MSRWFARRDGDDRGFTLIELTVAMVVAVTISVFAVGGFARYRGAVEHRGTAQEIVATLRNAQQRALAEATTYCVSFNTASETYAMYKFACGVGGTLIGSARKTASSTVTLGSASFTQFDGTTSADVSFVARGAATKGSLTVTRTGGTKTYTINVEGLTGRVSLVG